jgi:hypothetical protein
LIATQKRRRAKNLGGTLSINIYEPIDGVTTVYVWMSEWYRVLLFFYNDGIQMWLKVKKIAKLISE